MTRQAVAKHLSILEEAHIVSTQRKGREKLHFVNAIPIADVAEGWLARFRRPLPPLASLARRSRPDEEIATVRKPADHQAAAARPRLPPLSGLKSLGSDDRVGDDADAFWRTNGNRPRSSDPSEPTRLVRPSRLPGLRSLAPRRREEEEG